MTDQEIIAKLEHHIMPARIARIKEVAQERTRFLRVIVEDVKQDRNAGALIRTSDCFGVQEVMVIENRYRHLVAKSISKGSDKWVDVEKFDTPNTNNTRQCIAKAKEDGYHIVAATPHNASVELPDFKIDKPTAFIFGTEIEGLSEDALALADERLRIPIYGFTESFNISVSAALILQHSVSYLRKNNLPWALSDTERTALIKNWLLASLGNRADGILDR